MKAIFSLPGRHNDVVLNLKAEARNFQPVFFFSRGETVLHCLPVYHTASSFG